VQHRDAGEEQAVGDGDERVVQVRVRERPERDDREVRDSGDRAPERRLAGVGYLDGFF
jgi:hypothetical protein